MARNILPVPNEEAFILDGLLEIPDLVSERKLTWQPFQRASDLFARDFVLAKKKQECLPELRAEFFALDSHDEPLPELDSVEESTSTSETELDASNDESIQNDDMLEDVWSLKDVVSGTRENKLVNWGTFLDPQAEEPRTAYLSEAGPKCFDAVLATIVSGTNNKLPKVVAQHEDFLRSLFELGTGRKSLLYHFDTLSDRFVPATEAFGLPGISLEVHQDVLQEVLQIGNCMRRLRSFVAEPKVKPLSIALSSAISTVFYAVEAELQTYKSRTQSILQVKDIFSRPDCLMQTLQHLVKTFTTTDSARDAIIKLTHESDKVNAHHVWQAQILHEILRRISAPWIFAMEAEVGLWPGLAASNLRPLLSTGGLQAQEQKSDSSQETPLTAVEVVVSESRRCLEILSAQQADHPVLNSSSNCSSRLSWQVSWEGISRAQIRANEYEQALKAVILKYSGGTSTEAHHLRENETEHIFSEEEEGPILTNLDAPNVLDQDLGGRRSLKESRLYELTAAALTAEVEFSYLPAQSELCPTLSQSLSLSLAPLLNAQSRLLSFSTLHLLFRTHSLRTHLFLQYRFQLMSDGTFASRLSRALFDPDQSTGEGRRTTEGTTGLRLQARDTWPPASSELQLVLMGILSESYPTTADSGRSSSDNLPGNLSFAIRDLSAEELEKCRDVSSVEALDFLRLQYKAPPVLDSVITQSSLRKYDKIFKYMLRLLRVQAVAQSLLLDVTGRNGRTDGRSQRFRIDIQHFVSTLAAYSSNDAISVEWSRFQELLANIEAAVNRGDYEGTIAMAGSLARLERLHEEVLDRIIRALFLNRRQAQVRDVIDGIFGLILRFAGIIKGNDDSDSMNRAKEMHLEFRRQVGKLAHYLHSQGSASTTRPHSSEANDRRADDEPPFEHLLLKLDMFGFYT